MCGSMVDIQSATAEIRRGKKRKKKKLQDDNIMVGQCNTWPHVTNRHISISQLLSLWRHSHCDVIRYWAGHAHR